MAELLVILGGARSGKSALGERLVAADGYPVVYVGTVRLGGDDGELAARVAAHRARRPDNWQLIEDTSPDLAVLGAPDGTAVLVDGIGLWTAGQSVMNDARARQAGQSLVRAARAHRGGPVVVVAEEAGMGVVPVDRTTRAWVDAHGAMVQELAHAADRAVLVVAGRTIALGNPADLLTRGSTAPLRNRNERDGLAGRSAMRSEERVRRLVGEVGPTDREAAAAARSRHDRLAKPPGSLGVLETLGAQLSGIAGRVPPPVPHHPAVLVAAADHGVHAQGVTRWPQSVTAAMVDTMCAGRATVNALAATVGANVRVLDVGVAGAVADHPELRSARIRPGTGDLTTGPAMTRDEAEQAVLAGADAATELIDAGTDLLVVGDMGIANTTAAACVIATFTGADPVSVTGPGAGADRPEYLARKHRAVAWALRRHRPNPEDPVGVLAAVGGLEHGALTGAILAAAGARVPVLLDGLAANTAALLAVGLSDEAAGFLIAGHRSTEPGAAAALDHLALQPLLDLGLRLGEGSGGLAAVPLVQAAARVLTDVATLEQLADNSST